MESERDWAALQVDPSQNGVSRIQLSFKWWLRDSRLLSPSGYSVHSSTLEFSVNLASKQGAALQIYQEILGAKLRSRCIISTHIKASALWLVQATVQGRLGHVVSFYLGSKSRIDKCLSDIVSIFTNERTSCNFSHVHILKNETDLGLLPWKSSWFLAAHPLQTMS